MREATFKTEYKVLPDLLVSIRNSLVGERYKLSISETGNPTSGVSLEFSSREEVTGFGKTISENLLKQVEQERGLGGLLAKQQELDERIREDRELKWDSQQAELSDICTAMGNEVEELRDETDWKWWSDGSELDEEAAKEELIDILHFWLSAALLLGMDEKEIENIYFQKNEVNGERQYQGY